MYANHANGNLFQLTSVESVVESAPWPYLRILIVQSSDDSRWHFIGFDVNQNDSFGWDNNVHGDTNKRIIAISFTACWSLSNFNPCQLVNRTAYVSLMHCEHE